MPLATQSYTYQQPSTVANAAGTAGGLASLYKSTAPMITDLYNNLFG